ncbi:hypothetical protein D3C72_785390 [compost metagenome]
MNMNNAALGMSENKKMGMGYGAPMQSPAFTSPAHGYENEHMHMHIHGAHYHHCPPVYEQPVCHAPASSAGIWSSTGYILVLFILLVIITRGLWI